MDADLGTDEVAAGAAGPALPGWGRALGLADWRALRLADWLALREGADAAARAPELIGLLRRHLAARPPVDELLIKDLGAGTGSMLRWLAPRLPGAQRWILLDRDPELLARAGSVPGLAGPDAAGGVAAGGGAAGSGAAGLSAAALSAADGSPVVVIPQPGDLTELRAADLAGTALVTASALLDVLTQGEVDQLAAACVTAGCPALFALSVDGVVTLTPADDLDAEIADAFNAHQRRDTGERRLLGPAAVATASAAFAARGANVLTRPSPWCLGAEQAALAAEWLRGWVAAAVQRRPDLADRGGAYLRRRLDACAAGELRVAVQHTDLLAFPDGPAGIGLNRPG